MKFFASTLLSLTVMFLCFSSAFAAPPKQTKEEKIFAPSIEGDVAAGKIKSEDERCQECHGSDGSGQGTNAGAAGKFAKLAGQYPEYIVKQIQDFRSGQRKNDLMSIMAKSLDDADVVDIAAYFASQKKMHGDGSGANDIAKNLFANGDVSRNILPCASCHGADGRGIDTLSPHVPVIAGQDWAYLERQFQDWRSGERHNSAGGVMNIIAKSLTDAEIKLLTDYIAGLQ